MNKYILLTACSIVWNTHAQEVYYYAPLLPLTHLEQSVEEVGYDFGYVATNQKKMSQGYYLWLDDQWYEIVNAKQLFQSTSNGLAFYIDWARREDLKIKDRLDVVYSYPIEALDGYKCSMEKYNELSQVVVEDIIIPESKKETPLVDSSDRTESLPDQSTPNSTILDVIDIQEIVVVKQIPYNPTQDASSEDTELTPQDEVADTTKDTQVVEDLIIPAEIPYEEEENPYEKAIKNGFEGSVTEWIEMVTERDGISPYEQAVAKGYDRSETDYMRMLWGSRVNPEIDRKERDTQYVMDWIEKIKTSDGNTPYELALKHGFYGTFTEWVESVIGKDGEALYNEDVKKGYRGSYRSWLENKLTQSNEELARRELLKKQSFIMVPNMQLSLPENAEEVATFSLYNYYQMYYGISVISSSSQSKTIEIRPEELEYQITWFNNNEILINSISQDGIIYYQKNPTFLGNTTQINVRYLLK